MKPNPNYADGEEILDWDYSLESVPKRPSGTIEVKIAPVALSAFREERGREQA